ncbi:hypothetical protein [Nonomuraea sp. LPB2021202275-12-8]|uniref:hypothetical protein n=1 Tax=Nonomuraea sp. LPB2021202275-12-8 TaxID=3120159 RepID=UPI00300C26F2
MSDVTVWDLSVDDLEEDIFFTPMGRADPPRGGGGGGNFCGAFSDSCCSSCC